MSTISEVIAHAHGNINNVGNLTADAEISCQLDRFFISPIGAFTVTTSVGMGSDNPSLKGTVNAWSNIGSTTVNFFQLFQNVLVVVTTDDAGNLKDPLEIWATFERFPRVGN